MFFKKWLSTLVAILTTIFASLKECLCRIKVCLVSPRECLNGINKCIGNFRECTANPVVCIRRIFKCLFRYRGCWWLILLLILLIIILRYCTPTPLNHAPAITSSASASVVENSPVNTVVYTATATDADGDSISWSLSGIDAALLSIDAAGNVTLNTPADFESKATYSINVVATDNGTPNLSSSQAVTLSVTDVNEAPVISSGASASVVENSPVNTVVYTATATDVDGNSISWSLSGVDAALLSIDAAGNVTLNAPADFESKASYSFNVVATDNGIPNLSSTQAVTLSVTDVNESPLVTIQTGLPIVNNLCPQSLPTIISGNQVHAIASDPETPVTSLLKHWVNAGGQIMFNTTTPPATPLDPTVSISGLPVMGAIRLTVTDSGGLSVSDTKCIRVCRLNSPNCP